MAIIGFVNQKGGVGKSTTCYHFAYWLQQKWHNVLGVSVLREKINERAFAWVNRGSGLLICGFGAWSLMG